jgi:imidazoleglycerol-phosphate dehydratase
MLESFALHGGFMLKLEAKGDIHVDQHHLLEDIGLVLGSLFRKLSEDKRGLQRAGFFYMPMDDSLARVAVDFGGRPYLVFNASFKRRFCGELDLDLLPEFFRAFSDQARVNLHVHVEYGENDHHQVEAIFKGWARAMAMALSPVAGMGEIIPSAKGVIE